ncbi:MAG: hypothetical protein ACI9DF_004650 [Verrucomicrobiales bacterium]|jgi:hypothetical protein
MNPPSCQSAGGGPKPVGDGVGEIAGAADGDLEEFVDDGEDA